MKVLRKVVEVGNQFIIQQRTIASLSFLSRHTFCYYKNLIMGFPSRTKIDNFVEVFEIISMTFAHLSIFAE